VRFINGLDEALSHLVFAGSDIIMCQSFHDPLLQVPVNSLSLSLSLSLKPLGYYEFFEEISYQHKYMHKSTSACICEEISCYLDVRYMDLFFKCIFSLLGLDT
jgi:hypothetical protein